MKGTAFILFCAFALALSDESEEIQLNANGCPVDYLIHKTLPHATYCNLFYSCDNGDLVEKRCPANLLFNDEEGVCDWPINIDCGNKGISENTPDPDNEENSEESNVGGNNDPNLAPQICAKPDSDSVLVAHENCNEFYVCESGLPVNLQCPEDLLYNSKVGICDWPDNVECGDRIIPEKEVDIEPETDPIRASSTSSSVYEACAKEGTNGIVLGHENCNQFYKCAFGLPVAFFCPTGLLYNINASWCDWQFNVVCGDRPIVENDKIEENDEDSAAIGGLGHSDPSEAPAICAAEKSDSVLVAHENCNQFYKCWMGTPVALDCPLNLLYNPEFEICDWPRNVDCGNRVKSSRKH